MKVFKFIHIGCQEATLRCLKQREEPLSFAARIQLKIHMLLCKPCLEFARQVEWIQQSISKRSSHEGISFPESKKATLQNKINESL
nr:hypothetical protein [Chitinophagaceae bacterium]